MNQIPVLLSLDSGFRRNDGHLGLVVIPAPYQVRGKLQPESSSFKDLSIFIRRRTKFPSSHGTPVHDNGLSRNEI